MPVKSPLGISASRSIQRLQLIQGGCRTYRTTPRIAWQGIQRPAEGSRTQRSAVSKIANASSRKVSPKSTATSLRSFASTTKQFTLPGSQDVHPSPSSILQKAFNVFRFRQKRSINTRTRSTQFRGQSFFRQRFSTSRSHRRPDVGGKSEANDSSLGARMRRLSREYGWSALGVYFLLSALDFPFCYLLVRYLGTDLIGEWEETVVSYVKAAIPESVQTKWHEWRASMKKAESDLTGQEHVNDTVEMAGWGVEEAQERNKKEASLGTQLALAYAIHKSFIFIRVPLAAVVTPRVVKMLRGWGWDIGKKTTKAAKALKRVKVAQARALKKAKKGSK